MRLRHWNIYAFTALSLAAIFSIPSARADDETPAAGTETATEAAFLDGTGQGWREMTEEDFVDVNCQPDTWTWNEGMLHCTGRPIGVLRTTQEYVNFELVCQWRHLEAGGNSGIFVWMPGEVLDRLERPGLPGGGIEVQILDLAYAEQHGGRWFTVHGDIFPCGQSQMTPFPPVGPRGSRSFPSEERTLGVNQWNHYYVRCLNGEVRLWVNGREVSGGSDCSPASGYICLESEGAPIDFREIRIRELP